MAPRKNAAAAAARLAKGAPTAPTPAVTTPALPPARQTKPAAWWIRRGLRVVSLVAAGYYLYPKLFPTSEMVTSREALGEGRYAPIVVDVEKRAAVLDAFKVS